MEKGKSNLDLKGPQGSEMCGESRGGWNCVCNSPKARKGGTWEEAVSLIWSWGVGSRYQITLFGGMI